MSQTTARRPTPVGVAILAVLLILGGLFDLVAGEGLFPVADPAAFRIPILAFLLGFVYLGTGIGFFQKISFAWYIGLAISFLDIIRRIIFIYGDFISSLGIFVDVFIIAYLLQPRVQEYFKIPKQGQETSPIPEPSGY